jgi:hypothetical protein
MDQAQWIKRNALARWLGASEGFAAAIVVSA